MNTAVPAPRRRDVAPAQEYARSGARWAIVLAGGSGSRMQAFTKRWLGHPRPKQYCAFTGRRTMLEHTLERASAAAGSWRVVTIIDPKHKEYLLAPRRMRVPGHIIEQPQPRDTGPGVFLPLARVLAQDSEAIVALMPSDHFIFPRKRFLALLEEAYLLAERLPEDLVLLAARPDSPESDYGWILPGAPIPDSRALRVSLFREKPGHDDAVELRRQGALWNTMIVTTRAATLWEVGRRFQPGMIRRFEALMGRIGLPDQSEAVTEAYRGMDALNFSRDILEPAAERTVVLPMDGVRWCDWGRPRRVIETLGQIGKPPSFPVETKNRRRPDMTTAVAQPPLDIDYPGKDEVVNSSHYTFRMTAPEGVAYVEVSIDRGPWLACHCACGFWWFEWTNYQPGVHTLSARAVGRDGEPVNSLPRRFVVAGADEPPTPPLRRRSHRNR